MLLKRWLAAVLAVTLLSAAAAASDTYTVSPVPVDATAANATAARDKAVAEAQERGFHMLLDRLTISAADRKRFPKVTDAQLVDFVQSFEVANEHRSGVRYIADFTVHFRPDLVRQWLHDAGINFVEIQVKPLIVLPLLHAGERVTLWEDPNPWRDAWGKAKLAGGPVQLVRPLGDLDDVAAIDADGAEHADASALQAISKRYDNGDVLVTRATLKTDDPHAVEVTSIRYTPGSHGGEPTWATALTATAGESDAALMGRAIADILSQIQDASKAANAVDLSQSGTLTARVPIAQLQDWVAVRNRLTGIPQVRSSQLVSLERRVALLRIEYVGDPGQLRQALAQRDLDLSGNDPDWILQQRGGGPAR
jgi:hypothetical protein